MPYDSRMKLTVMLTPRSDVALAEAAKLNEETRTSVINRGIQLYLLITKAIANGDEVYIHPAGTKDLTRLTLL